MPNPKEMAVERANLGYLYTDIYEEATDSLEMTARFLEEAETDPRRWKWVVIALSTAVQNFMVLVLKNSWDVATQYRDVRDEKLAAHYELTKSVESGDEAAIEEALSKDRALMLRNKLDGFDWLYGRIKDKDHWAMQYLGNDKVFEPGATCDNSMAGLKKLRDDYMHFRVSYRYHSISNLALIAVDGLSVIEFLMSRDRLIAWRANGEHKRRAAVAFTQAKSAVSRLAERHPISPSDEPLSAKSTGSFVLQFIEEEMERLRSESNSSQNRDA